MSWFLNTVYFHFTILGSTTCQLGFGFQLLMIWPLDDFERPLAFHGHNSLVQVPNTNILELLGCVPHNHVSREHKTPWILRCLFMRCIFKLCIVNFSTNNDHCFFCFLILFFFKFLSFQLQPLFSLKINPPVHTYIMLSATLLEVRN